MKRFAAAAERNSEPIAQALRPILSHGARVLEVASGTGQHAAYLTKRFEKITFQPSDLDVGNFPSIEAYKNDSLPGTMASPIHLDVLAEKMWDLPECDVLVNINMIHITKRKAMPALMQKAQPLLVKGGYLYLYGPFWQCGVEKEASNIGFDEHLKSLDPDFGIWHLEDVKAAAKENGFIFERVLKMPAHNLSVFFKKN